MLSGIFAVEKPLSGRRPMLNRANMAIVKKHVRTLAGMTKRVIISCTRARWQRARQVNTPIKFGILPAPAPAFAVHDEAHLRDAVHLGPTPNICIGRPLPK